MEGDKSLTAQYIKIFFVIVAYWVVSISMVFMNSHLLSSGTRAGPALFITALQCVVTVIVCFILSFLSKMFPKVFWFSNCDLDIKKLWSLLPLSLCFVMMMTFNNICLKYVGVAFYTLSRSLTTVFNVIFTYLILHQRTSFAAMLCCAVIIGGFLLGIHEENGTGSMSVVGVVSGIIASASLSLYSIFTKKVSKKVDDSITLLTFYNNVNAVLLFIPLIIVGGEIPLILESNLIDSFDWWVEMVVVGVIGFAIGYVTVLQIQVTSPLTHNISGTAKACTQTVLAVVPTDDVKSFLWWFSNGLVLVGSALYTRVRQREMAKNHEEAQRHTKKDDAKPLLTNV